jgi:peroxiredoxin (alkyl hydroperoxide reductase subunit C)
MKAFQQQLTKLEAANTQVLGVSMDSTFANKAWSEQIGVTFPLLSDWGGEITRKYGLFNAERKIGRRATLVINAQGRIERVDLDTKALDPSDTVTFCSGKAHKG